MKPISPMVIAVVSSFVLSSVTFAEERGPAARPADELPDELQQVGIEERLGAQIPLDLTFIDANGQEKSVGSLFGRGKPVILNLVYFNCPMLCNLVMNGMSDAMAELDWVPGQEYEILTLSINPEEGADLAAAKKKSYLKELGKPGAEAGWHFWTGNEENIKALADSIGFGYSRDSVTGEFAHGAGIVLTSPEGVVSRYLYGIQFKPRDLRLALLDASEGKQATVVDRVLMFCYQYDPEKRSYVLFAQNTMRAGGYIVVVLVGLFLGTLWYREFRKREAPPA